MFRRIFTFLGVALVVMGLFLMSAVYGWTPQRVADKTIYTPLKKAVEGKDVSSFAKVGADFEIYVVDGTIYTYRQPGGNLIWSVGKEGSKQDTYDGDYDTVEYIDVFTMDASYIWDIVKVEKHKTTSWGMSCRTATYYLETREVSLGTRGDLIVIATENTCSAAPYIVTIKAKPYYGMFGNKGMVIVLSGSFMIADKMLVYYVSGGHIVKGDESDVWNIADFHPDVWGRGVYYLSLFQTQNLPTATATLFYKRFSDGNVETRYSWTFDASKYNLIDGRLALTNIGGDMWACLTIVSAQSHPFWSMSRMYKSVSSDFTNWESVEGVGIGYETSDPSKATTTCRFIEVPERYGLIASFGAYKGDKWSVTTYYFHGDGSGNVSTFNGTVHYWDSIQKIVYTGGKTYLVYRKAPGEHTRLLEVQTPNIPMTVAILKDKDKYIHPYGYDANYDIVAVYTPTVAVDVQAPYGGMFMFENTQLSQKTKVLVSAQDGTQTIVAKLPMDSTKDEDILPIYAQYYVGLSPVFVENSYIPAPNQQVLGNFLYVNPDAITLEVNPETPTLTDKNISQFVLKFPDDYFPTYVDIDFYKNGSLCKSYRVPAGKFPDGYTLPAVLLDEGINEVSAVIHLPSGPVTVDRAFSPVTFEYRDMYTPDISVEYEDGSSTVTVRGRAPLDTLHIVLDGSEVITASHSGGEFSYEVQADIGNHTIEVYSTYKTLSSDKAKRTFTIKPKAPIIDVPSSYVEEEEIPAKIGVYTPGLLRVYLDGSKVFEGNMATGTHTININLASEGTHTIGAEIEVNGVVSDRVEKNVVYNKVEIPAPTIEAPSQVEGNDVNIRVMSQVSGTAHIYIDGNHHKDVEVSSGVEKPVDITLPGIGRHVVEVEIEASGVLSPKASTTIARIPKQPTHNLLPRFFLRHFAFGARVEADGVLELVLDGKTATYAVVSGLNSIRVDIDGRGYHEFKMRLCVGDLCSRWVEHTMFVYDKIEMWIGKKEYKINLVKHMMDVVPFIDPTVNRTMVPLRFILEGLGFNVEWNGNTRMITITGEVYREDGSTYTQKVYMHMPCDSPEDHGGYMVYPGSPIVRVEKEDGTVEEIDMRHYKGQDMGIPFIYEDRTFVPVRFISEIFGAEVGWDGTERKVTIER